jgi:hypothetical protein
VHDQPGATLVPPASLKLDLDAKATGPKPAAATNPAPGPWADRLAPKRRVGPSASSERQTSWWTARATAGTVEAGFTKEEILKKPEGDPRAEGGLFGRLETLLRALG